MFDIRLLPRVVEELCNRSLTASDVECVLRAQLPGIISSDPLGESWDRTGQGRTGWDGTEWDGRVQVGMGWDRMEEDGSVKIVLQL